MLMIARGALRVSPEVKLLPLINLCSKQLKGQRPEYAHARASSVFSSKDNRTVILTQQDFPPDRTADGDLLFTFSSNVLDFQRSLSSYLKFGSRHEDSSRFYCDSDVVNHGCLVI